MSGYVPQRQILETRARISSSLGLLDLLNIGHGLIGKIFKGPYGPHELCARSFEIVDASKVGDGVGSRDRPPVG